MKRYSQVILILLVILFIYLCQPEQLKKRAVFQRDGRLIGGMKAKKKQFPWQAAIFIESSESSWFCGGALISHFWILTAGHCVSQLISATIQLGSNHLALFDRHRLTLETNRYCRHENYTSVKSGLANDIALLQIQEQIEFNDYIQPIALHHCDGEALGENVNVIVSGYGLTNDNEESVTNYLYYINLTTITNAECRKFYVDSIGDEFFCCEGQRVESTCHGDSGSPVVKFSKTGSVLVGIVSFGSKRTCKEGIPVGFTRISTFRHWIEEISGV